MQLGKDFTYTDTHGAIHKYKPSDLRYDLKHGFLKLQESAHNISHAEMRQHHELHQEMLQQIFLAQIWTSELYNVYKSLI